MHTSIISLFFLIFLTSTTTPLSITTHKILDIETFVINNSDIGKWATTALKFFDFRRCTDSNLGSPDECSKLEEISKSDVNIYIGYDRGIETGVSSSGGMSSSETGGIFSYSPLEKVRLSPNLLLSKRIQAEGEKREKVFAVLPDSINVKSSGEHDVVLVIDPSPGYNFGHLLAMFYIDLDLEPGKCQEKHQIYMTDRTCITLGRKPRCPIQTEENSIRYNQPNNCYVDFLPTVHKASMTLTFGGGGPEDDVTDSSKNLLQCLDMPAFAPCPQLSRPVSDDDGVDNDDGIRTKCKLFQRCDRGILIGGGWNPLHSTLKSEENLLKMESMLLSNGFLRENIKSFYANGGENSINSEKKSYFHSLRMKSELRGHITKICESKHCADSFFVYLNTPMTIHGDFLLWDSDFNGLADDEELYKVEEFLSDISACEAQRVIVVVDGSRSENLVSSIRKSDTHSNVAVFGAGDQMTRNGDLTNLWSNHSHPMACLKHIQQAGNLWMKELNPVFYAPGNILNLSISGAPCGDSYSRELRPLYQGCQNLPTSIWFSLNYGEVGDSSEEAEIRVDDGNSGKKSRDTINDSNASSYGRRHF